MSIRNGPVDTGIAAHGATAEPGSASMRRCAPRFRRQAGYHQHSMAGALESQRVKTTALGGERGDESGKKVQERQRQMLVDTLGWLMAVVVTAASVSAPAGARLLFAGLGGAGKKLCWLWVDGTYRGQWVAWMAQYRRFVLRVT